MTWDTDRLRHIFELQRELQYHIGNQFPDFTDDERAAYIRDNMLALTDELHEALRQTGWKPWGTSRHLNREAYRDELVDALHFFVNLCLIADVSAQELYAGYCAKREVNIKRHDNGYEGLSSGD